MTNFPVEDRIIARTTANIARATSAVRLRTASPKEEIRRESFWSLLTGVSTTNDERRRRNRELAWKK